MANYMRLGQGLPCKAPSSVVAPTRRPINRRGTVTCASADNAPSTSRRSVLALIAGISATTASAALADPPPPTQGEPAPAVAFPVATPAPTPQPNDPTVFNYDFVSDVPCNLRVREYWTIINQTRPKTWQQIAQQIQASSYGVLAIDLNLAPMADLRQAALYLPWALLQNYDYNAATDAMKAYKNLDEHIKDLQRAATQAAALPPADAAASQQAQQVQQAFILMSASLDGYLATVPTRYTAALNLFGRGANGNGGGSPAPAATAAGQQPPAAAPEQAPAPAPAPALPPAPTPAPEQS